MWYNRLEGVRKEMISVKKIIGAVMPLFLLLLSACPHSLAYNGDVVGSIYSTDIKACINGVWVDSYNIGGKTVVIVEDITDRYVYSDELRTLLITGFEPEYMKSGTASYSERVGTPVGSIYETDIKTIFRGKELTSYALNGKMAVVIEDLGDDGGFSDIGGRYTWNADERTINLESMYRYPYELRNMLSDKCLNIVLNDIDGVLNAEFVTALWDNGHILCEKEIQENSINPVLYGNEIIGYRCKFADVKFNDSRDELIPYANDVDYYYTDKIKDIISDVKAAQPTVDDWLDYFNNHTTVRIKDSFETDEYMFLYAGASLPTGGTELLIKLDKSDGTRLDYNDSFKSVSIKGQKFFENVTIDKENEKVYLHYDVDYVIDLKTDSITPSEEGENLLLAE